MSPIQVRTRLSERGEIESALTDAMMDVRVLTIVHTEASGSSAQEIGDSRMMLVDEDTFIAWMRACDRLCDSVRELSRVFHREPKL